MWWESFSKKEKMVIIILTGLLAAVGISGLYLGNNLIAAVGLYPLAAEIGYLIGITIVNLVEERK